MNGNEKVPCKELAVSSNLENGKESKGLHRKKKEFRKNKRFSVIKGFLGSKVPFPGAKSNFDLAQFYCFLCKAVIWQLCIKKVTQAHKFAKR